MKPYSLILVLFSNIVLLASIPQKDTNSSIISPLKGEAYILMKELKEIENEINHPCSIVIKEPIVKPPRPNEINLSLQKNILGGR